MDQEPMEQMDQDSAAMDRTLDNDVEQETPKGLVDETSLDMEQDPSNVDEPETNVIVEQDLEEKLPNDHIPSEKENKGEEKSDQTTVNGYLGYDGDGNVVLAEGDFVVGFEEEVSHVADEKAPPEVVLNGEGGTVPNTEPQETAEEGDDDNVLAYIATEDLHRIMGFTASDFSTDANADTHANGASAGVNGYDNHSDGEEEEEEEYEDGNYATEEVGESLDTAEAEEPLAAEEVAEVGDEKNLGLKFPLTRVKRIMKADPDMQLVSQDAVFLIAKATELFVEVVADASYHHTLQAGRKTLLGRDLDACIDLIDALAFLDGALDADQ